MVIKSRAPAKLIISGEHAVVYGAPAIALPVENNFAQTCILQKNSNEINFVLPDLNYQQAFTIPELINLQNNTVNKYQLFLAKKCNINSVLVVQAEIFPCALVRFAEYFAAKLQIKTEIILQEFTGKEISITANIPLYCGMGSSAATIVSLLQAVLEFLKQQNILSISASEYLQQNFDECFNLARAIENLQHGFSSGLDIAVALKNAPIFFQEGKIYSRKFSAFPLRLINTGRPASTTGECVTSAEKYFCDPKLLADFAAITNEIDKILQSTELSLTDLKYCIRENHQLLCKIGVVPDKVKALIANFEQQGFAAKISGAGAVKGDNAGIVIVVGEV